MWLPSDKMGRPTCWDIGLCLWPGLDYGAYYKLPYDKYNALPDGHSSPDRFIIKYISLNATVVIALRESGIAHSLPVNNCHILTNLWHRPSIRNYRKFNHSKRLNDRAKSVSHTRMSRQFCQWQTTRQQHKNLWQTTRKIFLEKPLGYRKIMKEIAMETTRFTGK